MAIEREDTEAIEDPRTEQLRAGIPGSPGAPGLDKLRDDYRRYQEQLDYHKQEMARCTVVSGYLIETAMKRLRNAGLSWDEIREELKTWH